MPEGCSNVCSENVAKRPPAVSPRRFAQRRARQHRAKQHPVHPVLANQRLTHPDLVRRAWKMIQGFIAVTFFATFSFSANAAVAKTRLVILDAASGVSEQLKLVTEFVWDGRALRSDVFGVKQNANPDVMSHTTDAIPMRQTQNTRPALPSGKMNAPGANTARIVIVTTPTTVIASIVTNVRDENWAIEHNSNSKTVT